MSAKTCRKVDRITDSKVIVEPGRYTFPSWMNDADRQKALEQWAKSLMEFFRDHRHQDVNDVFVEHTHQDQCSACGREWEIEPANEDHPEGGMLCASCGAIVKSEVPQHRS